MPLPLPKDELPEKIRRFGDPNAPEPARAMAAKGLVPATGDDLVTLLVQLSADPVDAIRDSATETLASVPEGVVGAACRNALHPDILSRLVELAWDNGAFLEDLAANRATPDATVANIAKRCSERICERIAVDQERLLQAPEVIEALYKNRNTRMSTVDRLVELAARNGVELTGVATFAAHVEAIQGQLIPEPDDEPLPGDAMFSEALEHDNDEEAIEQDKVDGSEEVKDSHKPLALRVANMNIQEKLRLSLIGGSAARAILVRDPNKIVCMAAITSPSTTEAEAAKIASSKQVSEDILRYIGNKRDWLGNYEVKRALIFNSKTPVGVSMKFLSHLRASDLRAVARSRNIPAALRTTAGQRVAKRGK